VGGGRFLAALLVAAVCLSGCGSRDAGQPNEVPTGLTASEAVHRVLASLGDPMVQGAEVVKDPKDLDCRYPCLRVRLNSNAGRGVREDWLGEMVVGAVGELMRTDQKMLSEVLAGEILDRTSNGQVVTTALGSGYVRLGRDYHSPSDADLRERVTSVANKYGVRLSSLQVLHPLDSALAVTFAVPDGPVDWTHDDLSNDLAGSPADIEGIFLQLDSPTGRPLFRSAFAYRFNGGIGWFAPGQDERFGFNHG
jgi:hypothetical protein